MNAFELAKYYFEVSNQSNFSEIQKLLTPSSTYSSQNTGLYLGNTEIIKMQQSFHQSFQKLNWAIKNIQETKPGIIYVDFDFTGVKKSGEKIHFSGLEYIIIYQDKIQHIEIRNK